jgi:hypothetical protein
MSLKFALETLRVMVRGVLAVEVDAVFRGVLAPVPGKGTGASSSEPSYVFVGNTTSVWVSGLAFVPRFAVLGCFDGGLDGGRSEPKASARNGQGSDALFRSR